MGIFWHTLHPMNVYKPHISTPLSLIFTIFICKVREQLVCESKNTWFSTKMDLTYILRKNFHFKPNFWIKNIKTHENNSQTHYISHFHHLSFHPKASLIKLPNIILTYSPQDRSAHLDFHFTVHSNSWIWIDFVSKHNF